MSDRELVSLVIYGYKINVRKEVKIIAYLREMEIPLSRASHLPDIQNKTLAGHG